MGTAGISPWTLWSSVSTDPASPYCRSAQTSDGSKQAPRYARDHHTLQSFGVSGKCGSVKMFMHEENNMVQTARKNYQKILVQNLSSSKSYIDDHFDDVISQNSRVFQKLCMFLVRAYLGRHREFCLSPLTSDVDTETRDNSRTVPQAHRRQVKAAKDRFDLTFCGLQQDGSLT